MVADSLHALYVHAAVAIEVFAAAAAIAESVVPTVLLCARPRRSAEVHGKFGAMSTRLQSVASWQALPHVFSWQNPGYACIVSSYSRIWRGL